MNNKNILLFDAFAGIGSIHKANKRIGMNVELAGSSEIDPYAIMSYAVVHDLDIESVEVPSETEIKDYLLNRNIGWDFTKEKSSIKSWKGEKLERLYKSCIVMKNYGDVSTIKPDDLPDFDLFNFSFPCQSVSSAGLQEGMIKENGSITKSGFYTYGINIIKAKKPNYIMIENVKGLIQKKFISEFDKIINELKELGYNCYFPKTDKNSPRCLNAKEFNVPQSRERIYVICIKKDIDGCTFKFPIGEDTNIRLKDILEEGVDEKHYLNSQATDVFIKKITSDLKDTYSQTKSDCDKNIILDNWNAIRIGGFFDTDVKHQAGSVWDVNGVSPTLDTMQGGWRTPCIITREKDLEINVYKNRVRKLSCLECLRLMGFDDKDCYKIKEIGISNSQIYKMTGNSIVVNVLECIFKNLFKL